MSMCGLIVPFSPCVGHFCTSHDERRVPVSCFVVTDFHETTASFLVFRGSLVRFFFLLHLPVL